MSLFCRRAGGGTETPLPHRKLTPLLLLVAAESFNGTALFAYVGYMVLDFGVADDKEQLGYYIGFIASMWYVAQFLSSFLWGRASDVYGHKPILLIGSCGSFISALLFGLSWSLPSAILFRSINGLLNGNIGVVKTAVGRATDSSNQARAFGLISLYGAIGGIAGAGLGGLTARLAVKYPETFSADSVWGHHPYLAPNLISCTITAVAIVLAYFFVPQDTPEDLQPQQQTVVVLEERETKSNPEATDQATLPSESLTDSEDNLAVPTAARDANMTVLNGADFDSDSLVSSSNSTSTTSSPPSGPLAFILIFFTRIQAVLSQLWDKTLGGKRGVQYSQIGKPANGSAPQESIFHHRNAILSCLLYALLGWIHTMYDELLPLWLLLPVGSEGLGFNTTRIGFVLGAGGVTAIVMQLFVFAPVAKALGMIRTFQLGLLLGIPVFFLFPFLNLIPRFFPSLSLVFIWVPLILLVTARAVSSNLAFSAVFGLVANSVHRNMMGSANGLGQSLVALLRAIGPVTCGPVYAWSLSADLPYPLDSHFMWNLLCVGLFGSVAITLLLPQSLNKPRAEAEQDELMERMAKHENA